MLGITHVLADMRGQVWVLQNSSKGRDDLAEYLSSWG